jgi:serine phosphatase RsbU (regulator of sigma subunit)
MSAVANLRSCAVPLALLLACSSCSTPGGSDGSTVELTDGWEYARADSRLDEAAIRRWLDEQKDVRWPLSSQIDERGLEGTEDFWVRINLPHVSWEDAQIYVYANAPGLAAYLDGNVLYRYGGLGHPGPLSEDRQPRRGYTWHIFSLPSDFGGKTLYARFPHPHRHSVDVRETTLARRDAVPRIFEQQIKRPWRRDIPEFVFGVLLSVIGYSAVVLFFALLGTWKVREWSMLLFGLFVSLYGVRLLTGTLVVAALFDASPLTFRYLDTFITHVILIPAIGFFEQMFGRGWKSSIRRLWQVALLYALVGIALDVWRGIPHSTPAITNVLVFLSLTVMLLHLLRFGQKLVREQRVLRAGFLIFAAFVLNENLVGLRLVPWRASAEWVGFWVFIICLADVVTHRVMSSQRRLALVEQELETARRIQSSILPRKTPVVAGAEIAVRYLPMAAVAGDFYEFLRLDEKRVGMLVADVSGHGVPAALIASMVKVAFAAQAPWASQPEAVLTGMNRIFCGKLESQFVTAAYLFADLDSGKVSYASAGHPPLLWWRAAEARVCEVQSNGMMMGHFPEAKYAGVDLEVAPGDRIILYTDGIVDATNAAGDFFGGERLAEAVASRRELSAESLVESLLEHLSSWAGHQPGRPGRDGFADDLTLMVMSFSASKV